MAATRSPQEVFDHHAQALGAEDLNEIVADYSDDAIFITPAGVLRGKDSIRQAFAGLLSEIPQATWDQNTILRGRHPVPGVERRGRRQPHPGRRRHLRVPRRPHPGADRPLHPPTCPLTNGDGDAAGVRAEPLHRAHQPTPLRMVVPPATTSPWRPTSVRAQEAGLLPGGHFDAYVKDFDAAMRPHRWLSLPYMKTVRLEEVEPDGAGR